MTLHDRIRDVVEERLALARALRGERWAVDAGEDRFVYGQDSADEIAYLCEGNVEAIGQFLVANDPADAILSAEHALSVLERHAIAHRNIGWTEDDDTAYEEIPVCGTCVPKHSHYRTRAEVPEGPCIEICELATRWRVEVDG
jgi:hypothetical protein